MTAPIRISKYVSVLLLFAAMLRAQTSDELYSRISKKIEADKDYSNLYSVTVDPADFGLSKIDLPNRQSIQFRTGDDNTTIIYTVYYLQDVEGVGDIVPLQLIENTTTSLAASIYSKATVVRNKSILLNVKDFIDLKRSTNSNLSVQYESFVSYIGKHEGKPLLTLPNKLELEHGIASVDNTDYLNYARVNDSQPYPDTSSAVTSSGRRDVNSKISTTSSTQIDVSFSSLSISLQPVTDALGVLGFGFEAGFGDQNLHLLSYQMPALSWGPRFLINFSGNKKDITDRSFIDLKTLVRSRVNTISFVKNSSPSWYPLFSLQPANVNVTSGASIDMTVAKLVGIPFVNVLIGFGNKDYADPYTQYRVGSERYAYFSTSEFEGTLSFFWNADAERNNLFRIDIGAGSHSIERVTYDSTNHVVASGNQVSSSTLQPIIALDYTHLSNQNTTLFGAHARYFDSRFSAGAWIKLLKISVHELRLEYEFVSEPSGRSKEEWETGSGNLLQLRYRLGF